MYVLGTGAGSSLNGVGNGLALPYIEELRGTSGIGGVAIFRVKILDENGYSFCLGSIVRMP